MFSIEDVTATTSMVPSLISPWSLSDACESQCVCVYEVEMYVRRTIDIQAHHRVEVTPPPPFKKINTHTISPLEQAADE